jgi:hypothetical protein
MYNLLIDCKQYVRSKMYDVSPVGEVMGRPPLTNNKIESPLPVWAEVIALALHNGLDKKLPQAAPKLFRGKFHGAWVNVAPRTQTMVYLIVTNAGVQLRASPNNASYLPTLRDAVIKKAHDLRLSLDITTIRIQKTTQSQNFSIRPMPVAKKLRSTRFQAIYSALDLVIQALRPYI